MAALLSSKVIRLTIWTVLVSLVPMLAPLDPVVKPLISLTQAYDEVHDEAHDCRCPTKAPPVRFDDGRQCEGAVCVTYRRSDDCPWWQRGPVRRVISAPFRWLFRGRR